MCNINYTPNFGWRMKKWGAMRPIFLQLQVATNIGLDPLHELVFWHIVSSIDTDGRESPAPDELVGEVLAYAHHGLQVLCGIQDLLIRWKRGGLCGDVGHLLGL